MRVIAAVLGIALGFAFARLASHPYDLWVGIVVTAITTLGLLKAFRL